MKSIFYVERKKINLPFVMLIKKDKWKQCNYSIWRSVWTDRMNKPFGFKNRIVFREASILPPSGLFQALKAIEGWNKKLLFGSDFNIFQHVTPYILKVVCSCSRIMCLLANNPISHPTLTYSLRVWPIRVNSDSCKSESILLFIPLKTCLLVRWSLCNQLRNRDLICDEH